MGEAWRVTVWGVRGGGPRTEERFRRFGGNTSCFSVERGDDWLILDAGTGLAALGEKLRGRGIRSVRVLLGHTHLDHVLGLAGFALLSDPEAQVHLYGEPDLRRKLERVIGPPGWPVTLEQYPARVEFHPVTPGEPFRPFDWLTVTALPGDHPGGCLLYRLEGDGKRLVYGLDCEARGDMSARLTEFARGAGLLIWDGNYAPEDYTSGWGHSTWTQGEALGREAGAERVWMSHFARDYDDSFLTARERQLGGAVRFAREGMVIEL